MKTKILITCLIFLQFTLIGQRKMTDFKPEMHGFQFENTGFVPFLGDGSISINFSGFCGGMTYAVGDYYYNNIRIPDQDYTPAPGTQLYEHIYSNQSKSLENIAGQVAEFTFNPDGIRNEEFWGWAVDEKLKELVLNIDQNRPTPILLLRKDKGVADNHWVMAVGYDLGGYQWKKDADPNVNNIKIIVYDPNRSGAYRALVPRKEQYDFGYFEYDFMSNKTTIEKKDWACRSFHPNKGFYRDIRKPPSVQYEKKDGIGKVYKLVIRCATGTDDLRGGNDNVNFRINFGNGTSEYFSNANLNQRWPDRSVSNAELMLRKPRIESDIKSIEISTNFKGGIGGDNWNLDNMTIYAYKNSRENRKIKLNNNVGSPWTRFTGDLRKKIVLNELFKSRVSSTNDIVKIKLDFTTGGDDLRGGKDNLDLKVRLKDQTVLEFNNVNGGAKWRDWSSKTVYVTFEKTIPLEKLYCLDLHATLGGGMGGDNWNLNILKAWAVKEDGSEVEILFKKGKPLYRFTGDRKDKQYIFLQ